ncbi:reactivating factor for ethanolamine ammonia lyase [Sorangium cellulosum]|uniref:Reactivating factor for ethanolamine ammonia lyase n=1 Tax=Sorangium cellulosum TaxID=56 RepID=A0A2L0FBE5_SORCE|nr:ethanolamine ammonia-lyase reactivating factor EutA [Sorangium cellulosum]AUX48749.1 reactivating factor for ethanolamine ammonia lyase [Sorangium cellulosum]
MHDPPRGAGAGATRAPDPGGTRRVTLIGVDFGSTTASAVVASAALTRAAGTGRVEIGALEERYRSEMALTPFAGDAVDLDAAAALLDRWLAEAGVEPGSLFGGGAIITGLAARRRNADALAQRIRARLGEALLAVAEDPCLESWVAFMGSAAPLSRARPGEPLVNLDIGGGTTNLALGLAGEVQRTGCLLVGARHVALDPRSRRIQALSPEAQAAFDHLGLRRGPGDPLSQAEAEAVAAFHVTLLEAALEGRADAFAAPAAARHVLVPFVLPEGAAAPTLTFSGGVGELIYAGLAGRPLPEPAHHGDLGVDLARAILASARLTARVATPASMGRATAYGLLRHATQLSGATLFLPRPARLPLRDLPILARLSPASADADLDRAADLFRRSPRGACLEIVLDDLSAPALRHLGGRLAGALRRAGPIPDHPLVLLTARNAGKALGGYVTGWGALPLDLLVIDEVEARGARFVQIGQLCDQVLPVSFYGMTP